MSSERYRWQAATGAIAGALTADAARTDGERWTEEAGVTLRVAEEFLAGRPVPVELRPADAVAVAVGLAHAAPPLLVDPMTVALIDAVRLALDSGHCPDPEDERLGHALELSRRPTFPAALEGAGDDAELVRLVGMFVGLERGLGAIPARRLAKLRTSEGRPGRRYVCGLANRLLGIDRPLWYDPRHRRGPKEVLPGLWLSNLFGLGPFTADHPDGLVLSLCDDEGRIKNHPDHVTFHLEDTPKAKANPSLATVVDDVLGEIETARSAGQPVLVHCRHGASRTGLILRILLVQELGLHAEDALTEAQCLWPHTSTWNKEWATEVERRAG
jgi:hypothetical protein